MSSDLRSSLIRLAHAQPQLRPALLPLLKEGAFDPSIVGINPGEFDHMSEEEVEEGLVDLLNRAVDLLGEIPRVPQFRALLSAEDLSDIGEAARIVKALARKRG